MQLSEKEQLFLNAAEFGQNDVVASLLMGEEPEVDANCMDYMGRSALILAIRCAPHMLLFAQGALVAATILSAYTECLVS